MQLGIDRLGRQEQQRRFGRLAGQDVFVADVGDVLAHRHLEGALGGDQARGVAGHDVAQQVIALERELGVDRDRARRVGQLQQAVDPRTVRESRLEIVGRGRQRALHQVVQLHFAEGAARLLVGQDVLQPDDLGRQVADLLLRRVDPDQPLAQVGDDLARGLLALGQAFVDHRGQRPLLFAQRLLDPLHGVGEGHLPLACGLVGPLGSALAQQDGGEADGQ